MWEVKVMVYTRKVSLWPGIRPATLRLEGIPGDWELSIETDDGRAVRRSSSSARSVKGGKRASIRWAERYGWADPSLWDEATTTTQDAPP